MSKIRTKPLRYQEKGVRKIHHFQGRALLADDMGLGKTLQALIFAHELGSGPIIVICPASLKWHWEREAWKHCRFTSQVLEGRKPPVGWRRHQDVIIINYDILTKWLPLLIRCKPRLVIVDECHKISNQSTLQSKNTKKLCRKAKNVIGISGTPLLNRPSELFPILNILRKDLFPSFFSYASRYCRPELKPWGWEYKGATHLDELHRLLNRTCMIRRRKADVLKELPAKTRNIVTLDIVNRKEYDLAVKDFITWLSKKSPHLAKRAAKAERLVKIGYLKRLAARLKLPAVLDWIDSFLSETDEKLIVFAVHKEIVQAIQKRYPKISVVVDGSTTGSKRQGHVDAFNKDKRIRIFIGNIKAAGVGWSCTSSSVTAFAEMGWTPGEHTQAEDRTHGLKRGRDGFVSRSYYLVSRDTIEEDLCKINQSKQKILEAVMDGERSVSDLNLFDLLTEQLTKAKKPKLKR